MVDFLNLIVTGKDLLFQQTDKKKEIVYWTCELIAGLILTIFLLGAKTVTVDILGESFRTYKPEVDIENVDPEDAALYATNMYSAIKSHPLNNEYGWIALFYAIKHILYTVDSAIEVFKNKKGMIVDLIGPFLTFIMWTAYCAYGFLYKWGEVYAGMVYRILDPDRKNDIAKDTSMKIFKMDSSWVLPLLVGLTNLGLWIFSIIKKRKSIESNQAASTWLIPFQMAVLSLHLEGMWLKPNEVDLKGTDSNSNHDAYEARNVFWLPYYGSFLGLILFCGLSFFMAFKTFRTCKVQMAKWVMWGVWWIVAFIFCLAMDTIIWESRAKYVPLATAMCCIGLLLAVGIAVVSIMKKIKGKDEAYKA